MGKTLCAVIVLAVGGGACRSEAPAAAPSQQAATATAPTAAGDEDLPRSKLVITLAQPNGSDPDVARVDFVLRNPSPFLLSYVSLGLAVYDKGGKFIAHSSSNAANLATDGEGSGTFILYDVPAKTIHTMKPSLKIVNAMSEDGRVVPLVQFFDLVDAASSAKTVAGSGGQPSAKTAVPALAEAASPGTRAGPPDGQLLRDARAHAQSGVSPRYGKVDLTGFEIEAAQPDEYEKDIVSAVVRYKHSIFGPAKVFLSYQRVEDFWKLDAAEVRYFPVPQ